MGSQRRGRAVHGRVEVNPSGEEPTDGPKQKKLKSFEIEPARERCFYVCQVLILGCWRRR